MVNVKKLFDTAHNVLEEAVKEHPNLAEAWLRLADFRLDRAF